MRAYHNFGDPSFKAALAGQLTVVRGKVMLSLLILKEELSRMSDLRFYLNKVGGKTQRKPKERNEEQKSIEEQQKSMNLKLLNLQPV